MRFAYSKKFPVITSPIIWDWESAGKKLCSGQYRVSDKPDVLGPSPLGYDSLRIWRGAFTLNDREAAQTVMGSIGEGFTSKIHTFFAKEEGDTVIRGEDGRLMGLAVGKKTTQLDADALARLLITSGANPNASQVFAARFFDRLESILDAMPSNVSISANFNEKERYAGRLAAMRKARYDGFYSLKLHLMDPDMYYVYPEKFRTQGGDASIHGPGVEHKYAIAAKDELGQQPLRGCLGFVVNYPGYDIR